jgi:DNA-binding XRE family transcriptional regulator
VGREQKSSDAILSVQISVELQFPAGQVMELPSPELWNEVWPLLDSHPVNTQGFGQSGFSFEVPNGISFEHMSNISPLYAEDKTVLQPSSYAEPMETMGDRIRMLRHSKGWTQQELGDRIGVSKVSVYQWERGITSDIKLRTFLKLVEELGTNTHYLLFGPEASRTQPRRRTQS